MSKAKLLAAALLSLGAIGMAQAGPAHSPRDGFAYHSRGDHDAPPGQQPVTAPEIDPASAGTALTLLMGGLAVIRGRRRSQN